MKRFLFLLLVLASTLSALSEMKVPAVDVNSQGIITHIQASTTAAADNQGGVFVDVEPFISVETQNSAKTAARVAAKKTGKNLNAYNVFFKVVANTEVVDGPSGGLALALLAYSEFTGKKLRPDLTATGSIELDGSVGQVGGIVEKINAAGKTGITLMFIPLGQRVQSGVDVVQYADSRWTMQVVEVKNLDEALQYGFSGKGVRVVVPERVEPPLVLENITAQLPAQLSPMRAIAEEQADALQSVLKSYPKNSVVYNVLAKSSNTTRKLFENGYYYSAANEAFVAQIQEEAFSLSNTSKPIIVEKVNALDAELSAFKRSTINDKNIEWAVGATLRWQWAKKRLAEVKEKIQLAETALPLLQDYAASRYWLSAAKQMDKIASSIEGKQLRQEDWKWYAEEKLALANKTLRQNPVDSEAVFHLDSAKQAFEDGEYFTSTFDASFVIAFARARGKLVEQAAAGNLPASPPELKKFQRHLTLWANLYYAHAMYSAQEAKRSNDFGYVINALKLMELSKELDANLKQLSGSPPLAPSPEAGKTQPQIAVTAVPASPEPYFFGAVALLVAAVLVGLTIAFFKRPITSKLRPEEKIELLEQRLLEGRISEGTYEKLAKKFEVQKRKRQPRFH